MRTTSLVALAFATLALSACETVHGAGKDISNAGSALSEESREVQSKL